jgi:hypothetical protein
MTKILIFASAFATVGLFACAPSQALPIGASNLDQASPNIVRVWDSCGVGRHRADWGQCVSNWAHGPGMRGCPYGYHVGYYERACFRDRDGYGG